jgi:putative ABC transport system permease protein
LGRVSRDPRQWSAAVDRLDLLEGSRHRRIRECGVERHLADHFALGPGDVVELYSDGQWTRSTSSGVAASAEYIWPARSRQDVLTSSDDFGVVFATS